MLEMFGIMTDTQATDVVTFDFKGTGVRCVVCGTIDYQMNFFLVHNVSKYSRFGLNFISLYTHVQNDNVINTNEQVNDIQNGIQKEVLGLMLIVGEPKSRIL